MIDEKKIEEAAKVLEQSIKLAVSEFLEATNIREHCGDVQVEIKYTPPRKTRVNGLPE